MTEQNYYDVLSIPRTASPREVRRSYRALAREYHPDFNPGDDAAAQKFRQIQEAYDVLSDPRKRKAYDYYGASFGARVPVGTVDYTKPRPPRTAPRPRPHVHADVRANPIIDAEFIRWPALSLGSLRFRLGMLALAGVFVIGSLFYLLLPNPAVKEFKRAQEALRHVRSWKTQMHIVGANSTVENYLQEISCPASGHLIEHIGGLVNGKFAEMTIDEITIGNDHFLYNEHAQTWSRQWNRLSPASVCTRLAAGVDSGLLPPFNDWLKGMYSIEKGSLRKSADGACREWKVVALGGFSARSQTVLCLGVKDHLPKFEGEPGSPGERHFYDWNVPIDIHAPTIASNNP